MTNLCCTTMNTGKDHVTLEPSSTSTACTNCTTLKPIDFTV